MKKKHILFMIILVAVLAVSFSYLTDSRKSIFIENVGDMTLSGYDTGDVWQRSRYRKCMGSGTCPLQKLTQQCPAANEAK